MSLTFNIKLNCPDCNSDSFIFSYEPHTIDSVKSCAKCSKAISKNDLINKCHCFVKNDRPETRHTSKGRARLSVVPG